MQLDEPLREREAEAGALALLDARLGLLELLEDPLVILGGDARAGVGDRDPHLAVECAARHVDGPARRRELHGVREQVEDHLSDPALVAVDDVDVRNRRQRDLDAVLRRPLAHHHDAALERLPQRERRDLELDLPGLDLGEVEDVVDQRQQVVGRGQDVVEVLRLLLVDVAEQPLAQHLREADDRVQRRPQLVRHVGEELRLVPARRLELTALLVELAERGGELPGPLLDLLLEARRRTPRAAPPCG